MARTDWTSWRCGAAFLLLATLTSGQLSLQMTQPAGPGSVDVIISGPAGVNVFTAFSFDQLNATNPGGGTWLGLHITAGDLLAQFFVGAPPFLQTLDGAGMALYSEPAGAVPNGLEIWAVSVGLGLAASNIAKYPPSVSLPTFLVHPLTFAAGGRHSALGDIDLNGTVDLAVSSAIWFGNGAFGYTAVAIDPGGTEAALVDLIGDANPELVVLDQVNLGLKVYPGNGTGVFLNASPTQLPLVCEDDGHVVVQDLDGDGRRDLLCSTGTTVSGGFRKYLQLSPGAFFEVGSFSGDDSHACVAGDFDGDATPDLLVHSLSGATESLTFYAGGTPTPHSTALDVTSALPNASTRWLAKGDLNGDGLMDAFWVGANEVGALLATGSGGFTFVSWGSVSECCGILAMASLGDVDGDGDLDAAWPSGGSSILVALNDGTGAVEATVTLNLGAADCGQVQMIDLDGDGDLDLYCGGTPSTIFENQ